VVEKRVRWYKEGKLPEEAGGTNLEGLSHRRLHHMAGFARPGLTASTETGKGTGELWKHFKEEVATQLGRGRPKP